MNVNVGHAFFLPWCSNSYTSINMCGGSSFELFPGRIYTFDSTINECYKAKTAVLVDSLFVSLATNNLNFNGLALENNFNRVVCPTTCLWPKSLNVAGKS
jgi:hypothetical protein